MAGRILFQESHITIEYDYLNDWIYADWKGDQNLLTVQDGCEKILQYLKQERCSKVLNDNTHVTSIWSEAAEWVGKDWFPRMKEAGLKYLAHVYSPNTYSRLSADQAISLYPQAMAITFEDIESAKAWLQRM